MWLSKNCTCLMKCIIGKIKDQSIGNRKRDTNRETISYTSFCVMQYDYKWLFCHNFFETHKLSHRVPRPAVYVDITFNHYSAISEPISCPHMASMISRFRRAKTKSFIFSQCYWGPDFKDLIPFKVIQNLQINLFFLDHYLLLFSE